MKAESIFMSAFFLRIRNQANRILSNPSRLLQLLASLNRKISSARSRAEIKEEIKISLTLFNRFIQAVVSGKYKNVNSETVLQIVAVLIYFINPADIIPDIIPVSGFIDDFTILLWVYKSVKSELDQFQNWEKANRIVA